MVKLWPGLIIYSDERRKFNALKATVRGNTPTPASLFLTYSYGIVLMS